MLYCAHCKFPICPCLSYVGIKKENKSYYYYYHHKCFHNIPKSN